MAPWACPRELPVLLLFVDGRDWAGPGTPPGDLSLGTPDQHSPLACCWNSFLSLTAGCQDVSGKNSTTETSGGEGVPIHVSQQVPMGLQSYIPGLAVDVGVGVTALPLVQRKPRSALLRAPGAQPGPSGAQRVFPSACPARPSACSQDALCPSSVKVSYNSGFPAFKPFLCFQVIPFDCGVFLKLLHLV